MYIYIWPYVYAYIYIQDILKWIVKYRYKITSRLVKIYQDYIDSFRLIVFETIFSSELDKENANFGHKERQYVCCGWCCYEKLPRRSCFLNLPINRSRKDQLSTAKLLPKPSHKQIAEGSTFRNKVAS